MAVEYDVIPTFNDAEASYKVAVNGYNIGITTRYNYSAQCWMLDLSDALDAPILTGLMLIPGIDILKPYEHIRQQLGSFVLSEATTDAYLEPDSLGNTTQLLWYAPDAEILLPE